MGFGALICKANVLFTNAHNEEGANVVGLEKMIERANTPHVDVGRSSCPMSNAGIACHIAHFNRDGIIKTVTHTQTVERFITH